MYRRPVAVLLVLLLLSCTSSEDSGSGPSLLHERDGYRIFEDDILLEKISDLSSRQAVSGVETNGFRLWDSMTIPYTLNSNLTNPSVVRDAIAATNAQLPIRFVPRQNEANYIEFVRSPATCGSHVGMKGGKQELLVGPTCDVINIMHELGHASGLWHEQTRSDRDDHVFIFWENILPGMEINFKNNEDYGEKLLQARTTIGEYDFDSIMHQESMAFSRNGLPTITRRDRSRIARNTTFSANDVNVLMRLYLGYARSLFEYSKHAVPIFFLADGLPALATLSLPPRKLVPRMTWPMGSDGALVHSLAAQDESGKIHIYNSTSGTVYEVAANGFFTSVAPPLTTYSGSGDIAYDSVRKELVAVFRPSASLMNQSTEFYARSPGSQTWTMRSPPNDTNGSWFSSMAFSPEKNLFYGVRDHDLARPITALEIFSSNGVYQSQRTLTGEIPSPPISIYDQIVYQLRLLVDPLTQKEILFLIEEFSGSISNGPRYFKVYRIDDPHGTASVSDVTPLYW